MNIEQRRRAEAEKAFELWTWLTLWAVAGSYLLTTLILMLLAASQD